MISAYAVYNPVNALILVRMGAECVGDAGIAWTDRLGGLVSDAYAAIVFGYSPRTMSSIPGSLWLGMTTAVLAAVGIVLLFRIMVRNREPAAALFASTVLVFPVVW